MMPDRRVSYVESWLKEAHPSPGASPVGPPGPSAPSAVSIPNPSSDPLLSLGPGSQAWDRLHLFSRFWPTTDPAGKKWDRLTLWRNSLNKASLAQWYGTTQWRLISSKKWIWIASCWHNRLWERKKGGRKKSKTRTADCHTSLDDAVRLAGSKTLFCVTLCCHWSNIQPCLLIGSNRVGWFVYVHSWECFEIQFSLIGYRFK